MPSERCGPRERARLEALLGLAPSTRKLNWDSVVRIDHERLWWLMRHADRGSLMQLLVRALDRVPPADLEHVLGSHCTPGEVGAQQSEPAPGVRAEVERFSALADMGHFYEEVPYRGREQSAGTHEFSARFNTALARCVAERESTSPVDLRAAIEMLMNLMRRLDDCADDLVFFTDEPGSWQVNAAWDQALPIYFDCLSRTVCENEYRAGVDAAIADFGIHGNVPSAELQRIADETWRLYANT